MAQRTGAERLLAPSAKSTSAGVALALVLAGLLLGGCGGSGSSESADSSTTSTGATAQKDPAASGQSPEAQAPAKSEGNKQAGADPKTSTTPAAGPAPNGNKHGPRVARPKGKPEQAPTPAEVANATVADITLTSPLVPAGPGGPAPLPATFTCDGGGKWPSLAWNGVPTGTNELILYAMNIAPVAGKLFVDWAVAGIDPALSGIEAGKLPKDAVVGTNSLGKQGYEICPEGSETYLFALYALPSSLSPKSGFDARELRQRILEVSGNVGLFPVTYTRG